MNTLKFTKLQKFLIIISTIILLVGIVLDTELSNNNIASADVNTSLDLYNFEVTDELRTSAVVDLISMHDGLTPMGVALPFYDNYQFGKAYYFESFKNYQTLMIDLYRIRSNWESISLNDELAIDFTTPTFSSTSGFSFRFFVKKFSATDLRIWMYVKYGSSTGFKDSAHSSLLLNVIDGNASSFGTLFLRFPSRYTFDEFTIYDLNATDKFKIYDNSLSYLSKSVCFSTDIAVSSYPEDRKILYEFLEKFQYLADLQCVLNYNEYTYWLDIGYNDGYTIGNEEGYGKGVAEGWLNGYAEGEAIGKSSGYDEGYESGYDYGYEIGGLTNNTSGLTFKNLIFGVIDAPFKVFRESFNFTIFGVNMSAFFLFIISGLLITFVIKKFK